MDRHQAVISRSGELFELHISRRARTRYGFDEAVFAFNGRVIFADFNQARIFAQRIAEVDGTSERTGWPPSAGELNAMGLIDELLHAMLARYRQEVDPALLRKAMNHLEERVGAGSVNGLLGAFVDEFPPLAVYRAEMTADEYLEDRERREMALEELLLLWLANANPAFAPYGELFADERLRAATGYVRCMEELESFLAAAPFPGAGGVNLLAMLVEPAEASPASLAGQLEFMGDTWSGWLADAMRQLLGGLDLLAEEHKPVFPPGPGPVEVPVFSDDEVWGEAPEAYSSDLDWMPRLVLLAKNAYVWLEQLSRRYGRWIKTLDQVPDRELDLLAKWGVTGLWLIGVWERSRASERIKRMMGDHDAVASAYSLQDYVIAHDIGGEAAFDDLKARAWERGIRMTTDMVPNHVGIDSRWVIEHPDWFISVDQPPFPTYSFNGPDLSDDERVGIFLEDHYFDRSDAAVVFKRVDHWTGDVRYIYHGNDGTSMPWNDTAQLDYRKPEVREAVIQTILHVARRSPVIRFDAAMTLAKGPYQRLWFPVPGTGGDIPSRAEHGMTRSEFDEVMPEEFWRQVVDRVAAEAPDTLLLAEAFWLLEGYFVRTLGMHRVYNSAFMNMLRDERNAEYRQLIKNTLEYDPQILKRYVNFMSNPDEETAVEQFGKGDKYFGVATLMATLPGLPMFGHGQVEGFAEKYGMEFRRPRWDELPDAGLVARHERQIFNLLHRRALFAEVDRFCLFDFYCEDGSVDENVFAYSNRLGDERALVVYNNRYGHTRGWLHMSSAMRSHGDGDLERCSLGDGLAIGTKPFLVCSDVANQREVLYRTDDIRERGLVLELGAYDLRVLVDFRELEDDDEGNYALLCDHLSGHPVANVERAVREVELEPMLNHLRVFLSADRLEALLAAWRGADDDSLADEVADEAEAAHLKMVEAFASELGIDREQGSTELPFRMLLDAAMEGVQVPHGSPEDALPSAAPAEEADGGDRLLLLSVLGWMLCRELADLSGEPSCEAEGFWFDRWLIASVLADAFAPAGLTAEEAERAALAVRIMMQAEGTLSADEPLRERLASFSEVLSSDVAQRYLGVNRFGQTMWFRGERLSEMLRWLELQARVELAAAADRDAVAATATIDRAIATLRSAAESSEFHFQKLIDAMS